MAQKREPKLSQLDSKNAIQLEKIFQHPEPTYTMGQFWGSEAMKLTLVEPLFTWVMEHLLISLSNIGSRVTKCHHPWLTLRIISNLSTINQLYNLNTWHNFPNPQLPDLWTGETRRTYLMKRSWELNAIMHRKDCAHWPLSPTPPILQVRRLRSEELRNSCHIQELGNDGDRTEAKSHLIPRPYIST